MLGTGGYGAVFKAVRLDTMQPVAIKLILPEGPSSSARPSAQERIRQLRNEIDLGRELRNVHVAAPQDWGETGDGQPFAVFEYLPGQTLRERLLSHGAMEMSAAVFVMRQVLAALGYMHGQGIVHCDIKPHNIMLPPDGTAPSSLQPVKLIDFGSAVRLWSTPSAAAGARRICSPAYTSPEQLRGGATTRKFDIYAWGLVLLECLSGKAMVSGHSLRHIVHQQISDEEIPMPAELAGHPLAALLRQAVDKDGRRRVGDTALLERQFQGMDLAAIAATRPGTPAPPSGAGARDHAVTRSCPIAGV